MTPHERRFVYFIRPVGWDSPISRPTQIAHDCGGWAVLAMLTLAVWTWVPIIALLLGLLP